MSSTPIGIYGAGGMGRDAIFVLESHDLTLRQGDIVGFIDDSVDGEMVEPCSGLPRYSLHQFTRLFPGAHVVLAIGTPHRRREAMERARIKGLQIMSAVDARTQIGRRVTYGEGTVLCSGTVIPGDVTIGVGGQINLLCSIGHDSRLGDFVTLSPGVRVSGNVTIGNEVFVGTNVVFVQGITIGHGARVAAGSVVTKDVPAGATAAGVPARLLRFSGTVGDQSMRRQRR